MNALDEDIRSCLWDVKMIGVGNGGCFLTNDEDIAKGALEAINHCRPNEVLVECGGVGGSYGDLALGGDAVVWLCGVRTILVEAYRNPEFIHRLLDIIHTWDVMRIHIALDAGCADVIGHRGWYEGAFFSTILYERFIASMIREEAELVHRAGAKFGYIITRNILPLLDVLKETGIDIIWGVDPVQDNMDLMIVKGKAGGDICLWGGVNSYITLGQTDEEIKRSVRKAIECLAPGGGFILSAVDAVLDEVPSEGLGSMIEAWREFAEYPSTH